MGPWYQRIDLFQVVAGGAVMVIAWFFIRTLQQIDRNQASMFDKLNVLSKEFYLLQGEHRAFKCNFHDHGKSDEQ